MHVSFLLESAIAFACIVFYSFFLANFDAALYQGAKIGTISRRAQKTRWNEKNERGNSFVEKCCEKCFPDRRIENRMQ